MKHVDFGEPVDELAYFGVEVTVDLEHRSATISFRAAHFSEHKQVQVLDRIRSELLR